MEKIDVLDDKGNFTGIIKSRETAHKLGLWHKTIHIGLIDEKRNILLQKRSSHKKINPNKWSISCSGHLSSGDSSITGAIREFKEELGITLTKSDFIYICTIKERNFNNYIKNNEFIDLYIVKNH